MPQDQKGPVLVQLGKLVFHQEQQFDHLIGQPAGSAPLLFCISRYPTYKLCRVLRRSIVDQPAQGLFHLLPIRKICLSFPGLRFTAEECSALPLIKATSAAPEISAVPPDQFLCIRKCPVDLQDIFLPDVMAFQILKGFQDGIFFFFLRYKTDAVIARKTVFDLPVLHQTEQIPGLLRWRIHFIGTQRASPDHGVQLLSRSIRFRYSGIRFRGIPFQYCGIWSQYCRIRLRHRGNVQFLKTSCFQSGKCFFEYAVFILPA